jgi:hypothetical protein
MASPIYDFLLSLQNHLGNEVSPELRAITFDIDEKIRGILIWFFYDAEITGELAEQVDIFMLEVNTWSSELDILPYEITQLDSNKPIPLRGRFAFLHYEKTLPKFERISHAFLLKEKDFPHHAIYRLDMQQALLGRVTPELRHVGVDADPNKKKLVAHFIYDGEISELNHQLANAAIQDSRISFPDYEMVSFIERVDYPSKMEHRGQWLAYWRQEWLFTDKGKVPPIRN